MAASTSIASRTSPNAANARKKRRLGSRKEKNPRRKSLTLPLPSARNPAKRNLTRKNRKKRNRKKSRSHHKQQELAGRGIMSRPLRPDPGVRCEERGHDFPRRPDPCRYLRSYFYFISANAAHRLCYYARENLHASGRCH